MLVIVVLLVAITGVMLLDLTSSTAKPAPAAVSQESVEVDATGGSVENELSLLHTAGEDLPADRTVVQIHGADGVRTVRLSNTDVGSDGEWSPGERLQVTLDAANVCSNGADDVRVTIVTETSDGGRHVIETKTLPLKRGQFEIQDGALVPSSDYTATVRLIGTAITAGAGGPPIPLFVEVTVGGSTTTPWPGDVNDGNNPRTWTVPGQSAGTAIAVNVTADAGWYHREVSSQHENSQFVHVLRDGDEAPDTQGFANQAGAGSYVDQYVEDGAVTLADNEAIFLFELGASDPDSAAADYQDAVVLVSLQTSGTVQVDDTGSETTVVCPGG